jgi:glycosyltransferase 2 family protein
MSTAGSVGAAPAAPGRRLALWLLGAVAVYLALTWLFGGADTIAAARRIGGTWVLVGLALTVACFALRALRWHFLLRAMHARVPFGINCAVYLAGIGLSATPGKVGETVRSAFLVRYRVPVGTSLAAFLADRLSDLHAVVLIALLPLAWAAGWGDAGVLHWAQVLAAVAAAPLVLQWVVHSAAWPRIVESISRVGGLRRIGGWMGRGARDFTGLWRAGVAFPSIALSLLAYGMQGAIFAAMVAQVAPNVGFGTAISIFGAATLVGAASFIPGGVGAMELALVFMLRQHDVDPASGLAAALCLRAVTFWFGLLLGALGLSVAARLQRC